MSQLQTEKYSLILYILSVFLGMPLAFQLSLSLYKLQILSMPALLFNFLPVKKLQEFQCKTVV